MTFPVPKSIVQLPDGSVQISIALENHTQKTVIRSIDDDCVSVVGVDDMGTNMEIMEEIGRVIKLIHNRFCLYFSYMICFFFFQRIGKI